MEVAPDRQKWFEHLCRFSSPDGTVHEHRQRDGRCSVEVFRGCVADGALFATLGLMDINLGADPANPVFTELLLDSNNADETLAKVLSTAAFHVLTGRAPLAPGVIFEGFVKAYFPEHPLPHLLLVPPFQWKEGMTKVQLESRTIHPLVAVPISDSERTFVTTQPPRALEHLWASKQTNVLDWSRASSV